MFTLVKKPCRNYFICFDVVFRFFEVQPFQKHIDIKLELGKSPVCLSDSSQDLRCNVFINSKKMQTPDNVKIYYFVYKIPLVYSLIQEKNSNSLLHT